MRLSQGSMPTNPTAIKPVVHSPCTVPGGRAWSCWSWPLPLLVERSGVSVGVPAGICPGPGHMRELFPGRCPPAGCRPWGASVLTGLRRGGGGADTSLELRPPAQGSSWSRGNERVTKHWAAEALPDTVSVSISGTGSLAPSVLLPATGRKSLPVPCLPLPSAGPPSPTRTHPGPSCTAAGLCRESHLVFSSNAQIRDLRRVVHTSPSSRRRAGVMRQRCMRYAVEIVLGSTAVVPLNAEGRVLTCFAHLLFTGNRQRGTKTCKEFLKGGLDECMIIFFPVSHFSMVVVCK